VALIALGLLAAPILAGCSSEASDGTGRPKPTTAQQVIDQAGTDAAGANDAACKSEKATVQTAAEVYEVQKGVPPANTAALVPDFLEQVPTLWQVSQVDGVLRIEPTAAGRTAGCT
jgi:hypothetical protein